MSEFYGLKKEDKISKLEIDENFKNKVYHFFTDISDIHQILLDYDIIMLDKSNVLLKIYNFPNISFDILSKLNKTKVEQKNVLNYYKLLKNITLEKGVLYINITNKEEKKKSNKNINNKEKEKIQYKEKDFEIENKTNINVYFQAKNTLLEDEFYKSEKYDLCIELWKTLYIYHSIVDTNSKIFVEDNLCDIYFSDLNPCIDISSFFNLISTFTKKKGIENPIIKISNSGENSETHICFNLENQKKRKNHYEYSEEYKNKKKIKEF